MVGGWCACTASRITAGTSRSSRRHSRSTASSRRTSSATAPRRYEPPWDLETHVNAIVETVGAAPAILVGHSFGGRLAFELAARAPKLVPRLVLLDPALWVLPHVALFAAENARKERAYVSFEEGVDRRYDESQLSRAPRALVEEELRGHLREDDGAFRYRYSQAAVVAAYGVMASQPAPFERARVPTLLVLGESSYLSPDPWLRAYKEALGNLLELVVVPGGHTILWDALDETAGAVTAFLDG